MAKTESTAVNELIDLVNRGKPLPTQEPGSDLFAGPRAPVALPLPRSRAPQGTREQALPANMSTPVIALPDDGLASVPASSAGIRMSTNVPSRGTTIPSLAEPTRRASSPKLPPPRRSSGRMVSPSSAGIAVRPQASSAGIVPPPMPSAGIAVRPHASSAGIVPPPMPSAGMAVRPQASSAGIAPPPVPARTSSAGIAPPPVPSRTSSAGIAPPAMESSPFVAAPRRAASPNLASDASVAAPSRMPAGTLPPPNAPTAAPFAAPSVALFGSPIAAPSPALQQRVDETWVGIRPRRRNDQVALAKKLVLPALACIGLGVGLGFYVTRGKHAKTAPVKPVAARTTPAPQVPPTETVLHPTMPSTESSNAATASAGGAMPEPPTKAEQAAQIAAASAEAASLTSDAPAAALAQAPTTKQPMAALVDIRIDTDPAGASITLVDRGTRLPLGSSPLATALDPSRQYDLIVEADGRAAQTVHVDPTTTTHVQLALGGNTRTAAPKAEAKAEPKVEAKADTKLEKSEPKAELSATTTEATPVHRAAALVPAKKVAKTEAKAESKTEAKAEAKAETMAASTGATGAGTLMVSAKPPCELVIDGASTGLHTPQKSIELAPGRHQVTFVNADQNIKKTVTVTIKAGTPTKLIEDLMAP